MGEKDVGFLVGKFAPLHSGHINFINDAATQVDKLYVVLCYDEKFINDQPDSIRDKLTLKNRLYWLTHTFKDFDHVEILFVDETDIASYPHGWCDWSNKVLDVLPEKPNKVFSSEPDYDEGFKKYFPNVEHIISTRDEVKISATQIRKDVQKYWDYMPAVVRKDFIKTVCVVGTESCGKTTLIKYLAKAFNTSWVEEYGRTFVENDLCKNECLLQPKDYRTIAYKHIQAVEEAKKTANRILFVDTNLAVTQYYLKMYEGISDPVIDAMSDTESFDVTIFLDDDVPWVDDGMRTLCDRSDDAKELLLSLVGDGIIKVDGSYKERLDTSKQIVNNLLGDDHA